MKTLRMGVLGTADIARTVIAASHNCHHGRITAVASRDPEKARRFAAQTGLEQHFGSYEALLHSGQVDCIYLPLPNSLHAPWALRCLEAGLPVLVEKPLTIDPADAQALLDASHRTSLAMAEGFMYRFHPLYQRLKELMAAGAIGRVCSLSGVFTFMLDDAGENPNSASLGGGALLDVGCYPIDAFRVLLGGQPLEVTCRAVMQGVDRAVMGILRYPGEVLAFFEAGIFQYERHGLAIHGTLGSLTVADPWIPGDRDVDILLRQEGQPPRTITVAGANAYTLELDDFFLAAAGLKPPRFPLEDSVANTEILNRCRQQME